MDFQHSTDAEEKPTAETDRSEMLRDILDGSIDTKLRLIQHHAKMARLLAEEVLDEEVESLAGERYSRKEEGNPFRRWGSNSGSIRIDGEKVPIDVPRVRDTDAEEERSLEEENFLALLTHGKRVAGQQGDPLHGSHRGRLQEGARVYAGDDRAGRTGRGAAEGPFEARTRL